MNIQPDIRPYTLGEGIREILGWMETAEDAGFVSYFETHRDRMTTDLRYTLKLIDAIPNLKLIADLSHYVVGQEFSWPIDEDNEAMIQRILARSYGFHGRVASREQVQIQIGFPQHKQWLDLFLRWWEDGFRMRAEGGELDELIFVPELAPRGMRSPGPTGRSYPTAGWKRFSSRTACARSGAAWPPVPSYVFLTLPAA